MRTRLEQSGGIRSLIARKMINKQGIEVRLLIDGAVIVETEAYQPDAQGELSLRCGMTARAASPSTG